MSGAAWGIIIFIIIMVIIVIVFLIWRFSTGKTGKTTNTNTPTPTPVIPTNAIKYGDTINFFNTDSSFGGFMATCGAPPAESTSTCSSNVSVLPESSTSNRWKILSTSGIATGTAIKYGEKVFIQSTSNNNNLGYCGSTVCSSDTGKFNVGTFNSANSNHTSSNWLFSNKGTSTSIYVVPNNNIYVQNTSGDLLWVCGQAPADGTSSCGINVTNVSNKATFPSLSTWQIRT